LAVRDEALGAVRRQNVAVLVADIVGFTSISETMPPESQIRGHRLAIRRVRSSCKLMTSSQVGGRQIISSTCGFAPDQIIEHPPHQARTST
jgi:class 3 adenylate cyclase